MAKAATVWRPETGTGEITPDNEGNFVFLETGGNLLLESGNDILFEDSVYRPKASTVWSSNDG